VSTLRELTAALAARGAASEWVAVERRRRIGTTERGALVRDDEQRTLSAVLHRDTITGRGSARFALDSDMRSLDSVVDDALTRAAGAVGPAWRMAAAAAPARVRIADPALERGAASTLAGEVAAEATAIAGELGLAVERITAEVVREDVALATSQGIEMRWRATEATVRAVVASGTRVREVAVGARRRTDLALRRELEEARRRLAGIADAEELPRGSLAIALPAGLLVGGPGGLGMLEVFAAQADAGADRLGLSRYRHGQPVAPGAAAIAEPLTIGSDGTISFAPLSAPMADDGAPVRRFTLVDRGVALGVALDPREAALRRRPPNAGVRNLVVAAGTASPDELRAEPVLELDDLAWLDVDAATGEVAAGVGLATLRDGGRSRIVSGGVVRFDAIAALALARRSATVVRRGAYVGPDLWRLPPALVD
jgi:predicted Zn-dependent protease